MASLPFDYDTRDYLTKLNALATGGMPRLRADSNDPLSAGVAVAADRQLVFNDDGYCADVTASCTLSFNVNTLIDGWGVFVNVITGTATINVASSGGAYLTGGTSKTITAGNAAYITSDGTGYRIFRFVAT